MVSIVLVPSESWVSSNLGFLSSDCSVYDMAASAIAGSVQSFNRYLEAEWKVQGARARGKINREGQRKEGDE